MRRLQHTGINATLSTSGSIPIVRQIEDVLAGIQSSIVQIMTEYNAEVYPVLSSLSQGRSETRWSLSTDNICPRAQHLDGVNIFVDTDSTERTDGGKYWDSSFLRPKTIKEAFGNLYSEIQIQIDALRSEFTSISGTGLTSAQMARIGMNIFDPSIPSGIGSLDELTQTHTLDLMQLAKDVYGSTWSLDGDGNTNLLNSVKEMVNALLVLHNGAWDTDIVIDHSSVITGISPREAKIIVGNSLNGDTGATCDYLDIGDGAGLALALAAASTSDDVYIRSGVYDLNLSGSPVGALTIPPGVRVRGAGKDHTVLSSRSADDQGVFILSEDSILEDVGIDLIPPAGGASGSTSVVLLNGDFAEIRNVEVRCAPYDLTEAGDSVINSAFGIGNALNCKLINPLVTDAPSFRSLGAAKDFYLIRHSGAGGTGLLVSEPIFSNGDIGISVECMSQIHGGIMNDVFSIGIQLDGASNSQVLGSYIAVDATGSSQTGIRINLSDQVDISNVAFQGPGATVGSTAISLESSTNCVIGKNRAWNAWSTGITLDGSSDGNLVLGNNMSGTAITDAGTGNDIAHNL